MWQCDCNHQNASYSDVCQKCNKQMPQKERNRIYKQRLSFARAALGIDYFKPIETFAKTYVGDDTISVDKISSAFFQVLNIIRKWFANRKKGFIILICIFAVFSALKGFNTPQNKIIRSRTHQISAQKCKVFMDNVSSKIQTRLDCIEFYFDTSETENATQSKQNFNEKMDVLNKNYQIFASHAKKIQNTVTDFIKNSIKEIRNDFSF